MKSYYIYEKMVLNDRNRIIYRIKGSNKNYIKYKNNFISLVDYKKTLNNKKKGGAKIMKLKKTKNYTDMLHLDKLEDISQADFDKIKNWGKVYFKFSVVNYEGDLESMGIPDTMENCNISLGIFLNYIGSYMNKIVPKITNRDDFREDSVRIDIYKLK